MSATVLVTGKLQRDPVGKTSGKGNAYSMATIRVGKGEDAQFFKIFVFADEAREELLSLGAGDSVSVSGSLKAEVYNRDDEVRVSLAVTVDRLISGKRRKKEHVAEATKPRKAKTTTSAMAEAQSKAGCPFDDGVPF